jgi:hypothetical protein
MNLYVPTWKPYLLKNFNLCGTHTNYDYVCIRTKKHLGHYLDSNSWFKKYD